MARKKNTKVTDVQLTKPQSRLERYLGTIAGLFSDAPSDPRTRLERYLDAIVSGGVPITPDTPTSVEGLLYGNSQGKIEGILPDLTAEEIAARIEAAKLISEYPRPNLLDNAYFVGGGSQQGESRFPINQRGQTIYTGSGYTIDRWLLSGTATLEASLTINSDCITIANGNSFRQKIEAPNSLAEKTVTLSALVERTAASTNSRFGFVVNNEWLGPVVSLPNVAGDVTLVTVTVTLPASMNSLSPWIYDANGTYNIYCIKLELGDHQTLAHKDSNDNWVLNEIPDYTLELVKCQRYQFFPETAYSPNVMLALSTSILVGNVYFPVIMRNAPTVSIDRVRDLVTGSDVPLDGTAFIISRNTQGIQSIRGGGIDNLTVGRSYAVSYHADSNL